MSRGARLDFERLWGETYKYAYWQTNSKGVQDSGKKGMPPTTKWSPEVHTCEGISLICITLIMFNYMSYSPWHICTKTVKGWFDKEQQVSSNGIKNKRWFDLQIYFKWLFPTTLYVYSERCDSFVCMEQKCFYNTIIYMYLKLRVRQLFTISQYLCCN